MQPPSDVTCRPRGSRRQPCRNSSHDMHTADNHLRDQELLVYLDALIEIFFPEATRLLRLKSRADLCDGGAQVTMADYTTQHARLTTSRALQARESLDPFHSTIFTNGSEIVPRKHPWFESFTFHLREQLTPCYVVRGDTRPQDKHATVKNTRLPHMSRARLIPTRKTSTQISNAPQEQRIDKSEQNSTNRSGPPGV